MISHFSRRMFLLLIGASGAGSILSSPLSARKRTDPIVALERALGKTFPISAGMQRIGLAYLKTQSEKPDRVGLIRAVFADFPVALQSSREIEGTALRAYLAERFRADFVRQDTVSIHGWVLAQSEAKFYALMHLL